MSQDFCLWRGYVSSRRYWLVGQYGLDSFVVPSALGCRLAPGIAEDIRDEGVD